MPGLDVSIALTNPLTLDTFALLRRKQVMNQFGETSMSIERIPVVRGVVYPEGLNELSRRAETQTNNKSIVVITRFAIRAESQSANDGAQYQPDIIVWRGDNFLVVRVEDYSNYARGFVKVTAESMDIVDQPTSPTGPSQDLELI